MSEELITAISKVKATFMSSHDYMDEDDVDYLFESAKFFYLRGRNSRTMELSDKDIPYMQWMAMAMDNIAMHKNVSNATSYRENGVSYTFDSAMIDSDLLKLLIPRVGVVK